MRTYYLAIFKADPAIADGLREQIKTEEGQKELREVMYRKLDPIISKRWGRAGEDFESWYPWKIITSEEYFSEITHDDNAEGGANVPEEYWAEEILLPNCTWEEHDIFVTEDYEKGHFFVYFSVDV